MVAGKSATHGVEDSPATRHKIWESNARQTIVLVVELRTVYQPLSRFEEVPL